MSKIRYNSVFVKITNTNNELFVIREIRELRIIDPWLEPSWSNLFRQCQVLLSIWIVWETK